jgi:hypothetical protein
LPPILRRERGKEKVRRTEKEVGVVFFPYAFGDGEEMV